MASLRDALQSQISGRHLRGTIWRIVFLSTHLILAIIVLIIPRDHFR